MVFYTDKDNVLDFYKKLERDGVLTFNDILDEDVPGGDEIGWISPRIKKYSFDINTMLQD